MGLLKKIYRIIKSNKEMENVINIRRLQHENMLLKEVNADLRLEHEEYIALKNDYKKMNRKILDHILDLRERVERLQVDAEKAEKNELDLMYALLNEIKQIYINKIIELDYHEQQSSSNK